jgi:CRISPR-associated protein Csx14
MNEFSVPLNLRNPGQFLACCGILEIADRMYGATGHFEENRFVIRSENTSCTLKNVLCLIANEPLKPILGGTEGKTVVGLLTTGSLNLRLGWWSAPNQRDLLKTWAGSRDHNLDVILQADQMLAAGYLDTTDPLDVGDWYPDSFGKQGISLDSRSVTNALDVGLSHDHEKHGKKLVYPFVTLLAFVGIERFSPPIQAGTEKEAKQYNLSYCTWKHPIPAQLLLPAALGILPGYLAEKFAFRVALVGLGEKNVFESRVV